MNHRSRRKPLGIILIIIFVTLVCAYAWQLHRQFRQHQLDRALIAAIKKHDAKEALAALSEGADANAKDVTPDKRPFWKQVWDDIRGKRRNKEMNAPTALLVALHDWPFEPGTASWSEADISRAENNRRMAISSAIAISNALVEKGASITSHNEYGDTPLVRAFDMCYLQTARLLLDEGANPNDRDHDGLAPLHSPAMGFNYDAVRLLLERGADMNALDSDGHTPLELALYFANETNSQGDRMITDAIEINEAKKTINLLKHWAATHPARR